ncbi:MAG: hypothetical protein L3K13_02865 [Thermoplasmata archaeon]|nr:hypothetical protein [Thermoplasmata archaeon]
MQAGLLIAAVILAIFAVLSFLTIVLWPLGLFFAFCAAVLILRANRQAARSQVIAVSMPTYPQSWHHPSTTLPPPLPPPIPVVMPVDQPQSGFVLPPPLSAAGSDLVWCRTCGRPQPPGLGRCFSCGQPI